MQLAARYWKWFNLVFLVRCIQLNHLEYTALFTTHLVFPFSAQLVYQGRHAVEERNMFYFNSRYCQHILSYIKTHVCNRLVHIFQTIRKI